MKSALAAIAFMFTSICAHADRYGVSESMSESDASVSDMFWGALIVGIAYLIWKKLRG